MTPANIRQYKFKADTLSQFKQSLVEVTVMLACAILLLALVSLVGFVSLQGARYFLPMSVYQVTTYPSDTAPFQEHHSSVSAPTIEYMLSYESATALAKNIAQKMNNQFLNEQEDAPRIEVFKADHLYLLSTHSGNKYIGDLVGLQDAKMRYSDLVKLEQMRVTVTTLSRNLQDIQLTRLQALHRDIDRFSRQGVSPDTPAYKRKLAAFERWQQYANAIKQQIQSYRVSMLLSNQDVLSIPIVDLQDIYQPNQLSTWQSLAYTGKQIYLFLTDSPKQAATSGGVFPAIFGTLLMVILMAVFVTPFGVIAAIYLHEYAPPSKTTAFIRISVSNMAAVPSVVYGVFGLGFFVYALGGSIDALLYREALPSPTFGTPGLLWAALTMGILTLPVVIVSTEEGLRRVPDNLRSGALALGATKFETIQKVVMPMASPGMLTGVILAIARAAGEVAPLILVGAVKFAPNLPIDGEFPFVHLERQFMHLGVFVYDGAFHNQTESQVSSLMFATCMLLLMIVFMLNISAILLRNKLRNKYKRF